MKKENLFKIGDMFYFSGIPGTFNEDFGIITEIQNGTIYTRYRFTWFLDPADRNFYDEGDLKAKEFAYLGNYEV